MRARRLVNYYILFLVSSRLGRLLNRALHTSRSHGTNLYNVQYHDGFATSLVLFIYPFRRYYSWFFFFIFFFLSIVINNSDLSQHTRAFRIVYKVLVRNALIAVQLTTRQLHEFLYIRCRHTDSIIIIFTIIVTIRLCNIRLLVSYICAIASLSGVFFCW